MVATPLREGKPLFSLFHSLRRETTTGLFLPEVDGLRFVAIFSVVLFHLFVMTRMNVRAVDAPRATLEALFVHGSRGVLLFFCISGFILGLPFARHAFAGGTLVRLRAYFLRRLTRLEPPCLLNPLLRFPFALVARHMTAGQLFPHLLASFLYLHTLIYGTIPLVHPPSWSLDVEVQFYILALFVATALYRLSTANRRYGALVFVLLATGLQLRLGFAEDADGNATRASFSILNFVQFFLADLVAADLFYNVEPKPGMETPLDVVALLSLVAFFYISERYSRIVLPFLGRTLVWSALRSRRFKRMLSKPFVYTVGGMCYSLYLTHSFVLQAVYALMAKLSLLGSSMVRLLRGSRDRSPDDPHRRWVLLRPGGEALHG